MKDATSGERSSAEFKDTLIVAPNLNTNFTGVTATIVALVPLLAKRWPIAGLGPRLTDNVPRIRFRDLLGGWRPPAGYRVRIWHARRNNEMMAGLVLKSVLRQPWKLVFTSAALRHHSWITRFLYRRMDHVIATSSKAASFLEVPSTIIMHGVDTQRFRPDEDRSRAWATTGLSGRYAIGCFGRIKPSKGTDRFVDAMCELLPRYPEFTAIISGQVTQQNAEYMKRMKEKIETFSLSDRIVFIGDLGAEAIPSWFRRLTVFVAPQRSEGFGLTPLEAMASGVAVVATDAGAAALLVKDGVTGYLVDKEDSGALTRRIECLMSDVARAEAMGRAARMHVVENHDIAHEVDAISSVYAGLAS